MELGQCQEFKYGGCLGNANNFASSEQCRERCSGKTSPAAGKGKLEAPEDSFPGRDFPTGNTDVKYEPVAFKADNSNSI